MLAETNSTGKESLRGQDCRRGSLVSSGTTSMLNLGGTLHLDIPSTGFESWSSTTP
jgi:hypothetical protein